MVYSDMNYLRRKMAGLESQHTALMNGKKTLSKALNELMALDSNDCAVDALIGDYEDRMADLQSDIDAVEREMEELQAEINYQDSQNDYAERHNDFKGGY